MDYYRYLEFSDKYGIIPVQNGKNLTLNVPVTAAVPGARGIKADCITDGACTESSTYFQKSSNCCYRFSLYVYHRYAERSRDF